MTIIWFTDEDRRRMREEREACVEYYRLFREFVRDEQPYKIADRNAKVFDVETGRIRPWPED